jgi:uncharacterized membrane protein
MKKILKNIDEKKITVISVIICSIIMFVSFISMYEVTTRYREPHTFYSIYVVLHTSTVNEKNIFSSGYQLFTFLGIIFFISIVSSLILNILNLKKRKKNLRILASFFQLISIVIFIIILYNCVWKSCYIIPNIGTRISQNDAFTTTNYSLKILPYVTEITLGTGGIIITILLVILLIISILNFFIKSPIKKVNGTKKNIEIDNYDKIKKLKELYDMNAITKEEYEEKKTNLLNEQ